MRIKHSRYINIEKKIKEKNYIRRKRLIMKNNSTAGSDRTNLINKIDTHVKILNLKNEIFSILLKE